MKRVVLDGISLQNQSAGIAVYTRALAKQMAVMRPDTEFVLFGLSSLGLRLLRIQPPTHHGNEEWPVNVRRIGSLLYPQVMGRRLITIDALVGNATLFHGTNYALPRTRHAARVVTFHDLALLRYPHFGTAAQTNVVRRTAACAQEADRIIADSESTCRDLIELLDVAAEKIRVVHIACDTRFRPLPSESARKHVATHYRIADPYILHVGTLEPRKNLDTLIRAYSRLRRERGVRHRLVLVGERGWKYEPLFALVDELGLNGAVQLTGAVVAGDLPSLYNAADLFVYPSLYEGFGLPPLEAMACGTPVVTSNVSSLPEVVGDAALLVDPRDEIALTDAINRALTDSSLREQMRARGIERARLFSWERCARETLAVYEEAIADRK